MFSYFPTPLKRVIGKSLRSAFNGIYKITCIKTNFLRRESARDYDGRTVLPTKASLTFLANA